MKNRRFWQTCRRIALVIAPLAFAACASHPAAHLPPPEAVLLGNDEGSTALQLVREQTAKVRTFKALSRTGIRFGDERSLLRHVFASENPDKLRIEALPLNGAYTLSLFVSSDGQALLLDPAEKKAEKGELNAALIRKVLRVPLPGQDLVSLIAGRIPPKLLIDGAFQVFQTLQAEKLYFLSSNGQYYFICSRSNGLPEYFEVRDQFSGRLSFAVTYSDWQRFGDIEIPVGLEVNLIAEDFDLSLAFSNIAVNQKLPERLFRADVPPDYRVHQLGASD